MLVVSPKSDFEPVRKMMMEGLAIKAVLCAVNLKLFDYLDESVMDADALAGELGVIAVRLEPVLDILIACGLLEKQGRDYANSELASEFLVTGKPLFQGQGMALTMRFCESVENRIEELLKNDHADRTETDSQWGVDEVMEGTAQEAKGCALPRVVDFIAGLPGFDDFRSMCDIGGNHGTYTLGVLERNPAMTGALYDLPHVVEQAQSRCDALGFSERVRTHVLDFRTDRLPENEFDLALTSHVLYAFKDDLGSILDKIREALRPGGWFVSHHLAGGSGDALARASLELMTRLGGYPSHFIDEDELGRLLVARGFGDLCSERVSTDGWGVIVAARRLR